MAMAFLPAALAGWTKPRTLQQQQEYERSLEAESSLQPEPPPASTRRWDVLMIAVDDLRSELSCSGPKGFDTHPVNTPHLCDLAKDSLMLLRSQASRVHGITPSRPHVLSAPCSHATTPSGDHGDLRTFACVDTHQSAPVDHPCL